MVLHLELVHLLAVVWVIVLIVFYIFPESTVLVKLPNRA